MTPQVIKATRGDEIRFFRSVRQCSLFLETPYYLVVRALSFGGDLDGWHLEKYDTIPDVNVLQLDSVIATTPKGLRIRFESILEAASFLRCNSAAILSAVKRGNGEYGTWRWSADDGASDAIEPTDANCCTFTVRGFAGRKPLPDVDKKKESNGVNPYEEREVIATGYYDEDFGVTLCPFCSEVITHEPRDFSGRSHLVRCLAGRDWSVELGIIKVYK